VHVSLLADLKHHRSRDTYLRRTILPQESSKPVSQVTEDEEKAIAEVCCQGSKIGDRDPHAFGGAQALKGLKGEPELFGF
jgi:hypothetical protein